jgi:DHA2 family multidrug resistance protein-like MFS transporter
MSFANNSLNQTNPRATSREWIGLAVLALPCLLYSMDLTVLNLAVPSLSEDLKPSSTQLLWIIDIYGFLVAGSLITMGTLGDRIGRRKLLLMGAAAFGVTSILAAFSTTPTMLIASRALLGFAGATLAPSTLSLIRNMFLDDKQRTVAISIWITSYSAGAAIGPPLGGLLLEYFWWGSVFLLAVPVMVLLLILGPMLLPEFKDPNAGKPDVLSAALSLVGVLLVIFGLKRIAQDGFDGMPAASILAGLAVAALFVRRQLNLADPLIDLSLFKKPSFSAALVTYMMGATIMFGAFVFIYQYMQLVLDLSPLEAGLWAMPFAGGFIVASMLSPMVVRKFRPAYVMAAGMLIAAFGLAILTQLTVDSSPILMVVAMIIISVGFSPVFTLATDLMIGSAPPERAGAASAIAETNAEFGGALGIAILGSLGTALYRGHVDDTLPAGVPPESVETIRSTLGGAHSIAAELPGPLGTQVLDAAKLAFVDSIEVTMSICAVLALCTSVLVAIMLRNVTPAPAEEASEDTRELVFAE